MIMSYLFPNMGHSYSNEMKEIRNNCCNCHVPTQSASHTYSRRQCWTLTHTHSSHTSTYRHHLPSRTENVVQKEELQNISDKLGIRKQFSSRSVYVLTFLGENLYLSFNRSSTNLTQISCNREMERNEMKWSVFFLFTEVAFSKYYGIYKIIRP